MATVKQRRKPKAKAIKGALALAKLVGIFPATRLVLDFDEEADVLYISLKRPQQATETVELDDGGILLHYRDEELVGITILFASKR
jgi:uncharacterized protein YuzE